VGTDRDGNKIFQQKGVDILLGIDVTRLAIRRAAQTVVIVGGDGDFIPLVKVAKDEDLIVRLYHSPVAREYAQELWDICDERFPINRDFVNACRR